MVKRGIDGSDLGPRDGAGGKTLPESPSHSDSDSVQRLVFIRHGEKPAQGLGLLSCRGLNRALKLPDYFSAHFPPPDYIFAPNPSVKVTEFHGDGQRYDCVRPLLTIAPTAVRFGVPVDTQLPYNDPGLLADTLLAPRYRTATIYLGWEHIDLVEFTRVMFDRFGHDDVVPHWPNSDFETVFVFTIRWGAVPRLAFDVQKEKLGPISDAWPLV
jgi:hypothetical protein